MAEDTHLDQKYFINRQKYNCPFCDTNKIPYRITRIEGFNSSKNKNSFAVFVQCTDCNKISIHLTNEQIFHGMNFKLESGIDSYLFFSLPTSYFTIDENIPKILRELITEAEGCLNNNYLTGSSACIRKAIYEFLRKEKAIGTNYDDKIKYMKEKFPNIDSEYFDELAHIKDMTSNKVHEFSWDKWDSKHIRLFIGVLKDVFQEIYVDPKKKSEKRNRLLQLREKANEQNGDKTEIEVQTDESILAKGK